MDDIERDVQQYCESVHYEYEEKQFPQNRILSSLFDQLNEEIAQFREHIQDLSRIIRLSLPTMSNGSEHGEKVQAAVLSEFAGSHFSAKVLGTQLSLYHQNRASYVKHVVKYPKIASFRQSLQHYDRNAYLILLLTYKSLRDDAADALHSFVTNHSMLFKPEGESKHVRHLMF